MITAVLEDITTLHVDCIVNAAKRSLMGGAGVDGAIHRAAGPDLLAECKRIKGERSVACDFGQAVLTGGYNLPARFVVHTVGPIWQGGDKGEQEVLASCYRNCLDLAYKAGARSIAFPAISTGMYGFPEELAAQVAIKTVFDKLNEVGVEVDVKLVAYDMETFFLYQAMIEETNGNVGS